MRNLPRLASLFFAIACLTCNSEPPPPPPPPNVVLILTDDQGAGDLSLVGNDSLHTPYLDRLGRESVQFERFYVSPVCAPTRASLLTGRYHLRTGCTWVTHRREVMRAEETTLAEVLRAAGYATGLFGKWHNGEQYPNDPLGQGFDEFFGFSGGHLNNYFDPTLQHNRETVKAPGYITDILTDKAIDFIARNSRRPFFCYLPYNVPHSPLQVPDKYFQHVKARGLSDYNAAIYGMLENLDDNIGRLLHALDSLGLRENTIVVFTSDNGPNGERFNLGMKGRKGSVDEGGVRVPLFIRFPAGGWKPNLTLRPLAAHIDLMPTLLDLCGITPPDSIHFDGQSLTPLLDGFANLEQWSQRLLFTFPIGRRLSPQPGAVRSDRYRWVLERDSSIHLYDMTQDPAQENDLAEQLPGLTATLGDAYAQAFQDVSAGDLQPPPIPVGYAESPRVHLPAPEASLSGALEFRGGEGWANDWIVGWRSGSRHRASWPLQVVHDGKYALQVAYACPERGVGTLLRFICQDTTLEISIPEAHDPPPLPSPDRVPRWEVYEKEWKLLPVGTLELRKGPAELELLTPRIRSNAGLEIKALYLERQPVQ